MDDFIGRLPLWVHRILWACFPIWHDRWAKRVFPRTSAKLVTALLNITLASEAFAATLAELAAAMKAAAPEAAQS